MRLPAVAWLTLGALALCGPLVAYASPSSRKVVISGSKAEYLQSVVNLKVAGKLVIPIARTISLAEAPALLASLERGKRLNGKAVVIFDVGPAV